MAVATASYSYKSYIEPTNIVKFVTNPHAPRLLLNVIPNHLALSTNMHNQVKETILS